MKWGRKYKLSNPPKESGEYCAFYSYTAMPNKRYYDTESASWYPNVQCFYAKHKALFGEEPEPYYRWAKILEE